MTDQHIWEKDPNRYEHVSIGPGKKDNIPSLRFSKKSANFHNIKEITNKKKSNYIGMTNYMYS